MYKTAQILSNFFLKTKSLINYIKNTITVLSFVWLIQSSNTFCHNKSLNLKWMKNEQWALEENFLSLLSRLFNTPTFIETGSYFGGTTTAALPYFTKIHTIELSEKYYHFVKEKFKNNIKVIPYLGDSSNVLIQILPNIKEKTLFWLDGHYSGGDTAQGKSNTPIIQELEAIEKSLLIRPVILIDDIHCFDNISTDEALKGYPSLKMIKQAIKKIDSNYCLIVFGDIAIAYHQDEGITLSPIIEACTLSRLFTDDESSIKKILEAEQIIAYANQEEKNVFKMLDEKLPGKHYALWYGLVLEKEKNYNEAYKKFKKAITLGLNHWRVSWYLAQSAYYCGKIEESKKILNSVIQEVPDFADAKSLLNKIEKK